MSDHLPECPCANRRDEFHEHDVATMVNGQLGCLACGVDCICPALRACTVRVLGEVRGAVSAPHLHDDACCSKGCTEQHQADWAAMELGLRLVGLTTGFPRPGARCDESCNCSAAPFLAAINRLAQEAP